MPRSRSGFAGLRKESRWQSKKSVDEGYEDPSGPDKPLPQTATWGFPKPSKKADDGASGTSTQNGADMDDVDRSDWPEIEELDSLGFTKG